MKPNDRHAALRLAQRYSEGHIEQIQRAIETGGFEYLRRQSHTRTVCKTIIDGHDVYFVYDRRKKRLVTVLTPEQAAEQLL